MSNSIRDWCCTGIAAMILCYASLVELAGADEPVSPPEVSAPQSQAPDLLRRQLYARTIESAWLSWQRGEVERARALLQQSDPELRSWEHDYLQHEFERSQRMFEVSSYGKPMGIRYVTFSPDGKLLAANSDDLHVRVWELERDQLLFDVKDETRTVEFDPASRQLVTGLSGRIRIRDSRSGSIVDRFGISDTYSAGMPLRAQFSANGEIIAVQGYHGGVHLVDAVSAQNLHHLKESRFRGFFRFHPTEKVLAIATNTWEQELEHHNRDGIEIFDVSGKTPTLKIRIEANQLHALKSLHFNPDGSLIAACGYLYSGYGRGRCDVFDTVSGELRYALTDHRSHLTCVRFSPDGTRLATGSINGAVQIWNAAEGAFIGAFRGHTKPVRSVAFHPGGTLLASGSEDGTIRLWDLEQPFRGNRTQLRVSSYVSPNLSADSQLVSTKWRKYDREHESHYTEIQFMEARSGRSLPPVQSPHGTEILALAESYDSRLLAQSRKRIQKPNGSEVATTDENEDAEAAQILITQRETNQPVNEIACSQAPQTLQFSRDHKFLYTAERQAETVEPAHRRTRRSLRFDVVRREVATGNELFRKTIEATGVGLWLRRLETSPDGTLLAAAVILSTDLNQRKGVVYLFDAKTGQELGELVEPDTMNLDFQFSPDGRRLAAAVQKLYSYEFRGYVSLWDLKRKEPTLRIPAHRTHIHSIAFTPDGCRMVSAGGWQDIGGGEICFWDPETGERVFQLDDFSSSVARVNFDPGDGALIAVGSRGTIAVYAIE